MDDDILEVVCGHIAPLVQMYGLYVVFHGHLSPGGGFSGGVILALSMIIFILVFGIRDGLSLLVYPENPCAPKNSWAHRLRGIGLLMDMNARIPLGLVAGALIIGTKIASFVSHDWLHIPLGTPGRLFSSGLIFVLTIGVGFVVASTVLTLFLLLVEEAPHEQSHR